MICQVFDVQLCATLIEFQGGKAVGIFEFLKNFKAVKAINNYYY